MEDRMGIEVKEHNNIVVIDVKGNLMGGPETTVIHEKVKELIDQDKKKVVINLSHVKWINSSGLGVLMGCLTSLRNAKGDLKLSGVKDKVQSLFMLTKLVTIFDTHVNPEDAVEAFQKGK
jgi:anti-sigma B factor antagonist